MYTYTCLDCNKEFIIKNKPKKNRFSGLCKNCSAKKAAINRVKVNDEGLKLCKKCNELKPANTDYFLKNNKGYFYTYCRQCKNKYLSDRYIPSQRIKLTEEELISRRNKRVDSEKIIDWARLLVNSSRHNAKRYGKEFDIDTDYVLDLYEKQNHKCYWFGVELQPSTLNKFPSKPSLDRLDGKKGYVKGNVVISCMAANLGRNSCDPDVFQNFCNLIGMKNE